MQMWKVYLIISVPITAGEKIASLYENREYSAAMRDIMELANTANQYIDEKEPWVIDALRCLHHPLRSTESVKYILPSLEILEELQITGDIFFPKMWLDATFYGHSSIEAVLDINLFLNENPNLPDNLKNKVIQSSDMVFRSSIIRND